MLNVSDTRTHMHTHIRVLELTLFFMCQGVPCITDCVVGELEKLGSRFRVAQRYAPRYMYVCALECIISRLAKDPRFERLPCMHKGTYADDCLVNRVTQVGQKWQSSFSTATLSLPSSQHKCYIVATCDRDLKRRIRKIPGVPIMYISQHRYSIERMPDAFGGKGG